MEKPRILLAEDEEHLMETIRLNLELEGYEVLAATDGIEAIKTFRSGSPDLVILDVMMPGLNGFDVCEEIRKENSRVPVLFLTAKSSGSDRVQGLRLGADDYLTKPFNLEELLLRVQILIRRSRPESADKEPESYRFGDNEVNFLTYEIRDAAGKTQTISKKEIALLKLLTSRKGEVVSREEILDKVWGTDAYPSSRTIDNYILAFRKYFEENQREPRYFHSVRGVGYKFTD